MEDPVTALDALLLAASAHADAEVLSVLAAQALMAGATPAQVRVAMLCPDRAR